MVAKPNILCVCVCVCVCVIYIYIYNDEKILASPCKKWIFGGCNQNICSYQSVLEKEKLWILWVLFKKSVTLLYRSSVISLFLKCGCFYTNFQCYKQITWIGHLLSLGLIKSSNTMDNPVKISWNISQRIYKLNEVYIRSESEVGTGVSKGNLTIKSALVEDSSHISQYFPKCPPTKKKSLCF